MLLSRSQRLIATGACVSVLLIHSFTNVEERHLRRQSRLSLCALLPAPLSKPLARAPSTAPDKWPQMAPSVSLLPEPVERPLSRYLHKQDSFYNRIIPDWRLQYKTVEQQFLYEGDFSLFVKEVTNDGAIVQDVVTGIFGFVPEAKFGSMEGELLAGATVHGARCTKMDVSVIQSPHVEGLRFQTGIVYEWDEANGEGYIIPSENQDAFRMIRVLRRDIAWHDSRILFPGQFVQFETALPEEVPIALNDDPQSNFALRVHSPEVQFSFEELYELLPAGASQQLGKKGLPLAYLQSPSTEKLDDDEDPDGPDAFDEPTLKGPIEISSRTTFPVMSGRPEPKQRSRIHPVLQRFAQEQPMLAEAESPSWLWEPKLEYFKEERYDPIVPLKLKEMPIKKPRQRILTHEVAIERGDGWKEAAWVEGRRLYEKLKPPGRRKVEVMNAELLKDQRREKRTEIRLKKLRIKSLREASNAVIRE